MDSIRVHMRRQLWLVSAVGAELFGTPDQYRALNRGEAVVLQREQLMQFSHPSMPANLADHALWTLTGDSTLTPVVP